MTGPRAPLSVRINDGRTDRHVTSAVRDLSFRKTAPGGFSGASMRLLLPRDTFTDLGPADKLFIYDSRTAATVWEGFTENPGTQDGPSGQGFDLSCLGTTILASDEARKLLYVDRDLSAWMKESNSVASATVEQVDGQQAGAPGIRCQFNPGQAITTSNVAAVGYRRFEGAQTLGGIGVFTGSGKTDTGYRNQCWSQTTGIDIAPAGGIQIPGASTTLFVGDNYATPPTRFVLQLYRSGGATNVADDNTWTWFLYLSVIGQRMNRNGTLLSGVAQLTTTEYVLAHWVAEDLLGRILTFCDKGLSRVDAGTYQITQFAYPEAARASQVLSDLALYEPDILWEILHSTPNGYVFNYRAWPTTARYEISVRDGYDAPGADIDLCNRIAVSWTDREGREQVTVVTASVPALGGAPGDPGARTRDAEPLTLPEGQGSAENALRLGTQVLASKGSDSKAATAVIKRPISDMLSGNMVYPWELEPGYLVRVRETGDVLRLTEMEYVDNEVATTLTLGEPQLTVEQRVAELSGKRL